ncbi:WSC domain-containing protein [Microdochium trichocladiopsis]|uniref:WSC domain-containing protein n=1 Tax=Microdochium trichocladiopsis TaxID=1682393 RepID=A0A9P8YAH4_9PEZI|nr:WSC domain-containing protein [Microdochium trichocladiopsis]KAH7032617.1 WSC domain-containing protein [Microdochium trichocladiopsis]
MILRLGAKVALALQALALLGEHVAAQQFEGDAYENSLPNVPGAEKAYWKITDKKGRTFTQLNYFSQDGNRKRLVPENVQRVVIIVHGANRDPQLYMSNMLSALAQVRKSAGPNFTNTQIITPYFPNGEDKGVGYPWDSSAPAGGYGSTSNALVWSGNSWMDGGNNQYPRQQIATSSYDCIDQIIQYFADKSRYPNVHQIVVGGHSAGAQFVHRYAAVGYDLSEYLGDVGLTLWVGNPNSYLWLNSSRPIDTSNCADYNDWRMGLDNYDQTYNKELVARGVAAVQANYNSKSIAYVRGLRDRGDTSDDCSPFVEGQQRDERFFNFINAFPPSCAGPADPACDTVDYVNIGHDAGSIFASAAGQARLFIDNFTGQKDKKPDYFCPRQQAGDSPLPDPTCDRVVQPPSGTFNGMTYQGCWTDSGIASLSKRMPDDSSNSVDRCTKKCADAGYALAGMEFGTQCFCGDQLTSRATQVAERGCFQDCAGDDTQICGGGSRLSLWGTGKPTVLQPPRNPPSVGAYKYAGCYKDNQGSKAMPVGKPGGSSLTLEKCASACAGYNYFGTEYASECTCANLLVGRSNTKTDDSDCSMPCSGDPSQFCGAGNRLTLYSLNGGPVNYQGSGSGSTPPATPSSSGTPNTDLVCPSSNGATYTSSGKKFTVQCGTDHAGNDLKSLSTDTFAGCIDACAATNGCVVVAYSGTACYLKNGIGAEVKNGVWGAVIQSTSTPATKTTSTVSSTTSSIVSASASSPSATPSSSPPPTTNLVCPDSDGVTYNSNGQAFTVQCGTDHAGNDLTSLTTDTFAGCVDACATTAGCVVLAYSGTACYLKNGIGEEVQNGVWGAIIQRAQTSSTTTSSSAASTISSTRSSSSSVSSAASSPSSTPATRITCPNSDGVSYNSNGKTFVVQCGTDHAGNDFKSLSTDTFAGCVNACATTDGCVVLAVVDSVSVVNLVSIVDLVGVVNLVIVFNLVDFVSGSINFGVGRYSFFEWFGNFFVSLIHKYI